MNGTAAKTAMNDAAAYTAKNGTAARLNVTAATLI